MTPIPRERCTRIKTWHVVISGFTQKEGSATGCHRLWEQLHSMFAAPDTHVALREWDSDWRQFAEHIRVSSVDSPTILVASYSWGAGYGLVNLAKHLKRRSKFISCAVLSDPVYCHPVWAMRWLAMLDWRPITIPSNVHDVRWFFQRENRPRAYRLRPERKSLNCIRDGLEITGVDHQGMDDLEAFHDEALSAAGEYQRAA